MSPHSYKWQQRFDFTSHVSLSLSINHVASARGEFQFHTLLGCITHTSRQSRAEERVLVVVVAVVGVRLLMDQHMYSWMTKQPRDEHKRIHETRRWHANTALRVTTHLLTATAWAKRSQWPFASCVYFELLCSRCMHAKINCAIKTLLCFNESLKSNPVSLQIHLVG